MIERDKKGRIPGDIYLQILPFSVQLTLYYLGTKNWTCPSCELRRGPHIFQYSTKEMDNQCGHWRRIFPGSASLCLGHWCACVLSSIGRGMKRGEVEVMVEVVYSPHNNATPSALALSQCPAKNLLIWRPNSSSQLPLCLSLFTPLSERTVSMY